MHKSGFGVNHDHLLSVLGKSAPLGKQISEQTVYCACVLPFAMYDWCMIGHVQQRLSM